METFLPKVQRLEIEQYKPLEHITVKYDGNITAQELKEMINDIFNEKRERLEIFTLEGYDGFLDKVPNKRTRRSKVVESKKKLFKYLI